MSTVMHTAEPAQELIRIATAGSVDDGKSTLIGRLLYDSKSIFADQLAAVEASSKAKGETQTNLALLTDGLRAEREQGITIDVAHRYFSTPARKFIIADTPGHEQYTRNMVTGASTADLAIILVDARNGLTQQTRRHAFITSLLGPLPFPVMHIDTGHNFDEVIAFRDETVGRYNLRLEVGSVQDDIDSGAVVEETGPGSTRNRLQTATLLRSINEHRFDAVFGGARRDEEKARAKERVFSFRDEFGQWDPRAQRPELWNIYNGRHRKGEHIRVFPLSNWTELDIWQYIESESIALPSLYYAHKRNVVERDGMLLADTRFLTLQPGEKLVEKSVRFRTIGDATCTGAVESIASTPRAVVEEVAATRITERGATRADDRISEAGMEDRKKEGYF
ncbi:Sulfate adenylate transferase%2C subunit 2 (CysD) [Mycobacteroides abscessus]|nr:Sulfate adenylate transferase%2C subunit 2 (CysD) [Mycobacteroides abscessus]